MEKIVKGKISHQANQWYKTESSKLSKLQETNKRKKIIKREKYVTQFKRTEVSLLIKARSRMLNLKNTSKDNLKVMFHAHHVILEYMMKITYLQTVRN